MTELQLAIRGRRLAADGTGRHLRRSAGFPVRFIAEHCGVSTQAVFGWELGTKLPTPEHAVKYARVLDAIKRELERTP